MGRDAPTVDVDGNEHERALVHLIAKHRRPRYAQLVSSAKGRRRLLAALPHFDDWEPSYIVAIPSNAQTVEGIVGMLRAYGAPPMCWTLSPTASIDGRSWALEAAIEAIVGTTDGTIVSSVPGALCYYEAETIRRRFIVRRPSK